MSAKLGVNGQLYSFLLLFAWAIIIAFIVVQPFLMGNRVKMLVRSSIVCVLLVGVCACVCIGLHTAVVVVLVVKINARRRRPPSCSSGGSSDQQVVVQELVMRLEKTFGQMQRHAYKHQETQCFSNNTTFRCGLCWWYHEKNTNAWIDRSTTDEWMHVCDNNTNTPINIML